MSGKICGTGSCIPEHVVTNDDIAQMVETNDAWIKERTGVGSRYIVKEETTVSMAVRAGKDALTNAGVDAEDIDLILVSTISSNVILPSASCMVQKELGARNATCFDLNAACTGFVFAYNTAMAYLESGFGKCALIIGSESLSNLVNWEDRGSCILFGDGAGAAVICMDDRKKYYPVSHSDGEKGKALTCNSRQDYNFMRSRTTFGEEYYIRMDGRAVFQFAVKKVPEVIRQVLERNALEKEEIDYYILHQANQRIVESVAKRLGEPIEKFPMDIQKYGNTSSASIPILLDELNKTGVLKRGQKIVLAGFGAGLSWGASVLEW